MASEPVLSSDVGKRTSRDLNPVIVISAIVRMVGGRGGAKERLAGTSREVDKAKEEK